MVSTYMATNLKYFTLPGATKSFKLTSMPYSSEKTSQFYSPQPMYQSTSIPLSTSPPPYSTTYPYSSSPNPYQLPQQQPQQYPYYTPSPQPGGQQFYQPPTTETKFVDENDDKAERVRLIGGIILIILGIVLMIVGFSMDGRVRVTRTYRARYN